MVAARSKFKGGQSGECRFRTGADEGASGAKRHRSEQGKHTATLSHTAPEWHFRTSYQSSTRMRRLHERQSDEAVPVQKPTVKKASPTPAVHRSGSGANLSRADSVHALIAEVQAENGVVNCHGSVEDEVLRTYMCCWFLPGYVGSLKAWHEALGSNEHSGRGNMVAAPLSSSYHHHQGKALS